VLIALAPGICLGLVGFHVTAAVVRYVAGPVAAPDGAVVAGVALLVAAVSVIACVPPARRAATADPLAALRGD
jgi:putative ABC transport system permease protein